MIFLSERDVGERLTMDSAIKAVEGSFRRQSQGLLRHVPRTQLHTPAGYFAAVCVADEGLGIATVKSYTVIDGELRGFVVGVSSTRDGAHRAVIEADLLTKIRTGAASGVAAKFLARPGVTTAGIIGCGRQAPFQLDAVRRALPDLQVKAWTRRPEQLEAFCAATGAQLAASAEEAAACDVVLTATTSTTPVVRGGWLTPGAVVIAIGGDGHGDRELDDDGILRAGLLSCDSIAASQEEAADLWAPADAGLIAWDQVVELHRIVSGEHPGRRTDDEIIFFKSNGLGAWDAAAAAVLLDSSDADPR